MMKTLLVLAAIAALSLPAAADTDTATETGTATASATVTATPTSSSTQTSTGTSTATRTATATRTMTPICGFARIAPGKNYGLRVTTAFDTVTGTTALTAFQSVGCMPAGTLQNKGRVFRFETGGLYSAAAEFPTGRFVVYSDQPFGKILLDSGSISIPTAAGASWSMDAYVTVQTVGSVSGTLQVNGHVNLGGATYPLIAIPNIATVSINTLIEHYWGAAIAPGASGDSYTQRPPAFIYLGDLF